MLEAVLQLGKINNIQKHISVITGLVVRVIVCFQFSSSFRPKSGNFFLKAVFHVVYLFG